MYLLDTNIVSNILYHPETYPYLVHKVKTVKQDSLYVSIVTAQEMVNGRLRSLAQQGNQHFPKIVQHYRYLQEALDDVRRFKIAPYGEAEYREFEKIPKHIKGGIMDRRIAATALARNFTLVTANVQHFEGIPNLAVQDWTTRPLEE